VPETCQPIRGLKTSAENEKYTLIIVYKYNAIWYEKSEDD